MSLELHQKIIPYSIPLFTNCFKVYPSIYQNSQTYLLLKTQQTKQHFLNSKYIIPIHNQKINSQELNNCHIPLQGQSFYTFVNSHKNQEQAILIQEQIWLLIGCIAKAFIQLKKYNSANKLNHFRQYNIRKLKNLNVYKLLFHESMISQLKVANQGICQWTDMYLSPEQLFFNKFIPQKSIVFSFGLMLLNLCANSDRNRTVYKQNRYEIDQQIIKYKLKIVKIKYGYSNNLIKFISRCLQMQYKKRWNFVALYRYLQLCSKKIYWKQAKVLKNIFTQNEQQDQMIANLYENQGQNGQTSQQSHLISQNQISQQQQNPRTFQYSPKQMSYKQSNKSQQFYHSAKSQKLPKTAAHTKQKFNSTTFHETGSCQQKNIYKRKKYNQQDKQQVVGQKDRINKQIIKQDKKIIGNEQVKQFQASKNNFFQHLYLNEKFRGTFAIEEPYENLQESILQIQEKTSVFQEKQLQERQYLQDQAYKSYNSIESRNRAQYRSCNFPGSSSQQSSQTYEYFPPKPNSVINSPNNHTTINNNLTYPPIVKNTNIIIQTSLKNISQNFIFKKHLFQIPKVIQSYTYLKINDCLKQIPQLIKKINKVGIWAEGDIYYGDLYQGKRSGLGLQIYANGQYYYGHFVNDLYEGQGFYYWNKNQYYFGKFRKGNKLKGLHYDNIIYQGDFKNNLKHGKGTCWYPTGQIYSGDWLNGRRHGQGYILQPDGPQFQGNWFEGQRKGQGYLQNDNMRIIGYWVGQQVQGQALIQYKNGDTFKGQINQRLQIVKGKYMKYRQQFQDKS